MNSINNRVANMCINVLRTVILHITVIIGIPLISSSVIDIKH